MPKNTAKGIPDRSNYGSTEALPLNKLVDYVVQKHDADRAGPHTDLRIGNEDTGLLSWAVRKGIPGTKTKHLAVQQPVHDIGYGSFSGVIPEGYGKGKVSLEDKGQALITRITPQAVHFTLAHKGMPERYALIKTPKHGDKDWLLINLTPADLMPADKKRYTSISPEEAESIFAKLPKGYHVQPKIDGASTLINVLKDKLEVLSFRQSKRTGGPIFHTERIFNGIPSIKPPKDMVGSILRGELYATDPKNRVVDPRELTPLLNSSVAKSLATQKMLNHMLKIKLFDIERLGNKLMDANSVKYEDRYQALNRILKYINNDKLNIMPSFNTSEDAKALWNRVRDGSDSLTREGVIIHPDKGNPIKAKLYDDVDVHIRDIFPGEGKYKGLGAGGFTYSLSPDGPVIGRVGTGFSDEERKQMLNEPSNYVGRVAKILHQGKFPSGSYRAPSFMSLHEDYPIS